MIDPVLAVLLITAGFVAFQLGLLVMLRRRTPLDLRPLPSYELLPLVIDEAVESNRPNHFSLGTSAIGGETTVITLAATDLLYYLIKRQSFSKRLPLVTLSDPVSLIVAGDTLRRAYLSRDNLETYRLSAVAWFPQGERSLAFAAGAANLASDANAANHVLLGNFSKEIAFLSESAVRRDERLIANSTTIEGQAIAYAYTNNVIIGEELFVGAAYLNRDSNVQQASLIALDTLRWIVIVGIIVALVVNR